MSAALRIIHITDLHLGGGDAVALLRDFMFRVQGEYKADAIFVTGDIIETDPTQWPSIAGDYQALWKDLGIPVFQCPGNHDIKYADDTYDVAPYEACCGSRNYTEMFKGFCIVGFDCMTGHSQMRLKQRARDLKDYGCNEQWPQSASMTERELAKIRTVAKRNPIILLQHFVPNEPEMIRADAAGVCAVFSGHWHASKIHRHQKCVSYNNPNVLFGGIDGSHAGCMIVDFKKDGSSRTQWVPKVIPQFKAPQVQRSAYKWTVACGATIERNALVEFEDLLMFSTWDRTSVSKNICYAVHAQDGAIVWKRRTEQPIKRAMIRVGELLIGNGFGGTVYAIDARTGKMRWTAAIGNGVDRFLNTSPISDGMGKVYTGNFHTFVCLDEYTGKEIWQRNFGSEFAATCTQPVYDQASHSILVTQGWRTVTEHMKGRDVTGEHAILDANNGEVTHLHKSGVVDCFGVQPCIHDGHVYSCYNAMYGSVYGTNTVVWSRAHSGNTSGSIFMSKKGLIVPGSDGTVKLIDPKNGFELWCLRLGLTEVLALTYSKTPHAAISAITEKGAYIYFSAQDHYLYKVHTASGKVSAKVALPAMSLSQPLLRTEGTFINDYAGNIHCLKSL